MYRENSRETYITIYQIESQRNLLCGSGNSNGDSVST